MAMFFPISTTIITEKEFKNLPTMTFERYLIAPWTNLMEDICSRPVEIPVCIGAAMVLLREKHEKELLQGSSFIEESGPPESEVNRFMNFLLYDCMTFDDCKALLRDQTANLIFCLVVGILSRLEKPLFPLSERTAKVVTKLILIEPVHPYDFKISNVLYKEAMAFCTDTETKNQVDKNKSKQPDNITEFLSKFYNCSYVSKKQKWRLVNVFNKRIFHDFHRIENSLQRNTIRFIMKNLMHITRRYVIANLITLRRKRNEAWTLNAITTQPHVTEYVMIGIASKIAPFMFQFPRNTCLVEDLAIRTMINIFCANTDRVWMPGQQLKSILINMEPSFCHPNCVCGRSEVATVDGCHLE